MKKSFVFVLMVIILNGCSKPTNSCFSYSPSPVAANTLVMFDASCSENAYAYNWNFGDGTSQTVNSSLTGHSYTSPGVYTVVLTTERKDGISIKKDSPIYKQTIVVQ